MPLPEPFDRPLKRRQYARAAKDIARHDALFEDTAAELIARLNEVKRAFSTVLDLSPFPFFKAPETWIVSSKEVAFDEERLPFAKESFDLAVSNLGLHWINDLPGTLTQIHAALKSGGLFLASLIGEQSLHELRACLMEAEIDVTGGVSPRLSPMLTLQDAGALLHRAGFRLPVVDVDSVTLIYKDMNALMQGLRRMGQTNAHTQRLRIPTRRSIFERASALYRERFGDEKGHIPATFDRIYLHGWKP